MTVTAGRKPLYFTDEQRAEARKAYRDRSKAKNKNITVDEDLVEALNATCDRLALELGFRPTMSQTVRHLIKKASSI
jgi:hypothetical protein